MRTSGSDQISARLLADFWKSGLLSATAAHFAAGLWLARRAASGPDGARCKMAILRQVAAPRINFAASRAAQRQGQPNGHENPATDLVEASPRPGEPRANPGGRAGYGVFGDELGDPIGGGDDAELHRQAALRIDELRQQGTEEQQAFGIGRRSQETCTKQ